MDTPIPELIERLQEIADCDDEITPYMITEISKAADALESMQARVKEAEEFSDLYKDLYKLVNEDLKSQRFIIKSLTTEAVGLQARVKELEAVLERLADQSFNINEDGFRLDIEFWEYARDNRNPPE